MPAPFVGLYEGKSITSKVGLSVSTFGESICRKMSHSNCLLTFQLLYAAYERVQQETHSSTNINHVHFI